MKTIDQSVFFRFLAELGEDVRMAYATFRISTLEVDWTHLNHEDFDGQSGFYQTVEQQQSLKPDLIVNTVYDFQEPSLYKKILAIVAVYKELRLRHTRWKNFSRIKNEINTFGCLYLKRNLTDLLKKQSLTQGVSMSTYALLKLDGFVSSKLLLPDQERWWMIPVNMRSAETKNFRGNLSSYISLEINDNTSACQLQDQKKRKLSSSFHWAAYFFMKLSLMFGKRSVRSILSYYDRNNHGWTGIFNYLPYEIRDPRSKDFLIVGMAPATKAHPVSFTLAHSHSECLLGLKAYSGLLSDNSKVTAFLSEFLDYLNLNRDEKSR